MTRKTRRPARPSSRGSSRGSARRTVRRTSGPGLLFRLMRAVRHMLGALRDKPSPSISAGGAGATGRAGARVPLQRRPGGTGGLRSGPGRSFGASRGGLPPMPPAWEPDRPAAHRRQFPTLTDAQRRALWAREHGYTGALDADGHPVDDPSNDATDDRHDVMASDDARASAGADLGGAA